MKNIITGAIAVVAVVAGVSFFGKTTVNVPAPVVNVSVPEQKTPVVNVGAPVVNVPKSQTLGAATGPDISSPYFSFGDVRHWAGKQSVASTGSTTCAILSPAATSTLVGASSAFTRLASTTVVEIGLSSSAYATTTLISASGVSVTTGGGVVVASSTAQTLIVPPNSYVTTKIGGGSTAGTVTPTGTCIAVFREVF